MGLPEMGAFLPASSGWALGVPTVACLSRERRAADPELRDGTASTENSDFEGGEVVLEVPS